MMKYKLTPYYIWEVGKRKDADDNPHQEDCIFPLPADISDDSRFFIVCDGMGGHDAGEVASSTVCETLGKCITSLLNTNKVFTKEHLKQALSIAYDKLDDNDTSGVKKMGTTLAMVVFHNQGVMIAHIGDSRVYHIRPGLSEHETTIMFQTEDHSLLNSMVKAGELTLAEARQTVKKNIITRAMQPNSERYDADVTEISDIQNEDWFYICSDGMLEQEEMADGSAIKRIFSNEIEDDMKASILKGATEENADNHSAIVIKVNSVSDESGMKSNEKTHNIGLWNKLKFFFK